jgi:hypothetical protein
MTVEFAFGDPGNRSRGMLPMGLPLLSGEPREPLADGVGPAAREPGFSLWRSPAGIAGYARANVGEDLEAATGRIYAGLLQASRGLNLYRIWNCVPHINAASPSGVENYRAFCKGRSLAFETELGAAFASKLPAASGVGTAENELTVVFLAGPLPTRHFENPAQVPAYEYPPEHGPRAPSFARATVVSKVATVDAYISGTSAVVGHETVAPNETIGQLDCTIENLRLISRTCGLGDHLGIGFACRRHFKVYLRHPGDLAAVSERVERRILSPADRVTYLGAEICRAALNVEIEVAIRGADRS